MITRKLKVGDKVIIAPHVEGRCGNGCFSSNDDMQLLIGMTVIITRVIADQYCIDLDNGRWVWASCMFNELPVTNQEGGVYMEDTKKEVKKKEKKLVCEIVFTRSNGDQALYIKATPEIEALFTTDTIDTSSIYKDKAGKGLRFYRLSDKLKNYIQNFNRQRGFAVQLANYGTDLYADSYANFSILRTCDIKNGVTVLVNNLILDTDVQRWTEQLAHFVKYLHQNFIEKTEIKATINLEV